MEEYRKQLVHIDLRPAPVTLRNFGLALALVAIGRALWHGVVADTDWMLSTGIAVLVAGLALWRPGLFRAPYIALGVLTFPIRWLLAFTTLAALYFLVLTPVAGILRVTRRAAGPENPPAWRISPARGDKSTYFRQF